MFTVGERGSIPATVRRTLIVAACVALVFAVLPVGPALATHGKATPVRLSASLLCQEGGVEVTFTIENLGHETLQIQNDFHIFLTAVGRGGQQPLGALFVFPAPTHKEIPAGEQRTFILPFSFDGGGDDGGDDGGGEGDGDTGGEEGTIQQSATVENGDEVSAQRLIVGAEVFFVGRDQPVTRHFSFPACN